MNALDRLETNIQRCLAQVNRLRSENENMLQERTEAPRSLDDPGEAVVSPEHRQEVVDQLTALKQRIESLNIDTIMNE